MSESRAEHAAAESGSGTAVSEAAEHATHDTAPSESPGAPESPGQADLSEHREAERRDPEQPANSGQPGDSEHRDGPTQAEDRTQRETTDQQDGETEAATPDLPAKLPAKLTFRITPISLLAVFTIAFCVTPAASAMPWMPLLYLIPLALLGWILRVRTVVTTEAIIATTFRRTRMSWDEIQSIKVDEGRWTRAVLSSGKQVLLPAVRVRDLPRLAAMSGGRLPRPSEFSR